MSSEENREHAARRAAYMAAASSVGAFFGEKRFNNYESVRKITRKLALDIYDDLNDDGFWANSSANKRRNR